METHELQFMYKSGDAYHFMNTENYDQLEIDAETLGDNAQWMQENMIILAEYYDGRPIGIDLPQYLVLDIVDTAPVMKTATKTASSKPATLSNGVTVNVPGTVTDDNWTWRMLWPADALMQDPEPWERARTLREMCRRHGRSNE